MLTKTGPRSNHLDRSVLKPSTIVEFSPKLPWRSRVFRWLMKIASRLLFRISTTGGKNIPKGNCIIVANHLSWIDHLLLMTVLPAEPRPYLIGASQSICSPFKTWLVQTFGGVIPVERGAYWIGKDSLKLPIQILECGASLVLFPEGDVSGVEGEMLPLKRGIGHIALQADYPILPIALSGVKELYWRKPIQVVIGKPFRVHADDLNHRAAISAAVDQVETALRTILPSYKEPVVKKKRMLFLNSFSDRV